MANDDMHIKTNIRDLAFYNGQPTFKQPLFVNKPNLGNRDYFITLTDEILDSGQFTNNGPKVTKLETEISKYLDVNHCVVVNNGTMAMLLMIKSLELMGEVIIPSFNFISTAHTLSWLGIKPIFCDIDINTHNIDPSKCEELITDKTTAIIATHIWGRSCDVEHLSKIAQKHHLHLIFDAAHAFGCTHNGKLIGSFGDAEVFSFHATKAFHTFEGGAITTTNKEIADKLRIIRNFGFVDYDEVIGVGTNGKMPEICAAMGLSNLKAFSTTMTKCKETYLEYKKCVSNISGVKLIDYDEKEKNNCHYIVLEIDEQKTRISRDDLIKLLHAENIIARRYFYPGNHKMEPYRSLYPSNKHMILTDNLASNVLLLPSGATVNNRIIENICALLRFLVEKSDLIKIGI